MKINKLWGPMIVFGIIGGIAKICDTLFNVNGVGFIVNSDICSAVFVCSIVLVWLIGIIMLLADRKVEVQLTPPKSKATGFFGFISAVSILGSGIISLFSLGNSESPAGTIILIALGLLGGVVMLYEACISFTGHNGMTKFPLATLLLPAWACGRLISLFIQYSKVSIHATEMFDVISVTLLMLFLFYQAMFFAEIGPRTAVRRTTLYGVCYVMCGLITTIDILIKMFSPTPDTNGVDTLIVEPTLGRILLCVTDLSFVCYAVTFIVSNARNAKIDKFEEDDDVDDPEFLGAISEDRSGRNVQGPEDITPVKQKAAKRSSRAAKKKAGRYAAPKTPSYKEEDKNDVPEGIIRGPLRFEDEENDEAVTDSGDITEAAEAVEEVQEYDESTEADEETVTYAEDDAETETEIEVEEEVVFSDGTDSPSDSFDEDSQEDYDEIFRMLDELGGNDE